MVNKTHNLLSCTVLNTYDLIILLVAIKLSGGEELRIC